MQRKLPNVDRMLKILTQALALTALLAGVQSNAIAAQPLQLPTFSISYTLENNYITAGTAELTLKGTEEQGYLLTLQTNPTGMFRFSNKGKIREQAKLASLSAPFLANEYSYTNHGDKKRSYVSSYDREQGTATTTFASETTTIEIEPDAVDRLSMTLAVMDQLNLEPDIEKFSVKTLDKTGTHTVEFVAKGQESVKTEKGKFTATRIDRPRTTRNTVTWFAPLGPTNLVVPVQIEQYKRGKMSVRLRLKDFSIN